MNRTLAAALVVTALSVPAFAQEQAAGPQVTAIAGVVMNVFKSLNLSDDQKTAIKVTVESHKDQIQTARESGDPLEVRRAFRTVFQEIATNVLTPEQRLTAKEEIKKSLAERQSAVR
jgi:Spy/CpxP family protein refolding chaperone